MTAVRCTAPKQGHVPGSQAQRECPVHGNRTGASPLPVPAAPSTPAPEPASEHKQRVRPDGTVVEEWRKDGKLHRDGGPAYVKRHPDGAVFEGWYRNGELRREDGPAWVEHRRDGTAVEEWYEDGVLHREDGPAYVKRHPDGTVIEGWCRNNRRHREDGPAYVERRPDGTVVEQWRRNGTGVEPWEVLGRYLLRQGVPKLSAEALKQIAKDVPWQRWDELGPDHPLVALWGAVHPRADISAN